MDYLTDILADLDERIDDIQTIGDINHDVLTISANNLKSIRKDIIATGRNQAIQKKIEQQLSTLTQVSQLDLIREKLPVLYEQMIVLMIGALEVFITDIFRGISNRNPEYFIWKADKEKIAFEPSMLKDDFTLGDIIIGHLKNQGFSFQDLQSTTRAFEKYFDIAIELDTKATDILIISAASRNIIVHNRSKIDRGFLNQVRNTMPGKAQKYKKDAKLSVEEKDVEILAATIKGLCKNIVTLLIQRDDNENS